MNRNERLKKIIEAQLGENGLEIFTILSCLIVFAFVIIISKKITRKNADLIRTFRPDLPVGLFLPIQYLKTSHRKSKKKFNPFELNKIFFSCFGPFK